MPSISQSFRLAVLPRVASLSNFAFQTSYLQVADDLEVNSNRITIGISEAAISQYVLNPTPKLVLSIPIPSTNIVTACDVDRSDEDQETWCYALQADKVCTLNVATKVNQAANGVNPEDIAKVKVDDRVVGIHVNGRDKTIIVVLNSGLIQFYDYQLKLLHSLDVSYSKVGITKFFTEGNNDFLFILCSLPERKVCFKLFELSLPNYSHAPIKELSSIILEDFSLENSKICYQSGKLYRLVGDEVSVYALPQCQLVHTVKLPMIKGSDAISVEPISSNRFLVTADNKIYLLDLTHNSILFERELTHLKSFQLLKSAVIDPRLAPLEPNQRTFVIGVGTKHGKNPTSSLEIVNVDVGTGTLKDSLGKGFTVSNESTSHHLQPLFSDDDEEVGDDEEIEHFNFDHIYQQLEKNKDNISSFDRVFLRELNIKKEHYTELDRFICDQDFLSKAVHLILNNFKEAYPKALTFLLTHPLFPADCTPNLLSRLREHPRLFKQAIVTCPNLPLSELLSELFSIENGELSLDLSLRVLQDYTKDMIKTEVRKLNKIDVQNFIQFIISSKDGDVIRSSRQLFQLLSLVLDSIGLFALDSALLELLSSYVDEQTVIAERNSELCNLLDDRQNSRISSKSAGALGSAREAVPKYTVEYLDI